MIEDDQDDNASALTGMTAAPASMKINFFESLSKDAMKNKADKNAAPQKNRVEPSVEVPNGAAKLERNTIGSDISRMLDYREMVDDYSEMAETEARETVADEVKVAREEEDASNEASPEDESRQSNNASESHQSNIASESGNSFKVEREKADAVHRVYMQTGQKTVAEMIRELNARNPQPEESRSGYFKDTLLGTCLLETWEAMIPKDIQFNLCGAVQPLDNIFNECLSYKPAEALSEDEPRESMTFEVRVEKCESGDQREAPRPSLQINQDFQKEIKAPRRSLQIDQDFHKEIKAAVEARASVIATACRAAAQDLYDAEQKQEDAAEPKETQNDLKINEKVEVSKAPTKKKMTKKAKAEAKAMAKAEARARALAEATTKAEAKARAKAEAKAKAEAAAKAKAETKARAIAEARATAKAKARQKATEAKAEAEVQARAAAKAKAQAEAAAKAAAKAKAKAEAEVRAANKARKKATARAEALVKAEAAILALEEKALARAEGEAAAGAAVQSTDLVESMRETDLAATEDEDEAREADEGKLLVLSKSEKEEMDEIAMSEVTGKAVASWEHPKTLELPSLDASQMIKDAYDLSKSPSEALSFSDLDRLNQEAKILLENKGGGDEKVEDTNEEASAGPSQITTESDDPFAEAAAINDELRLMNKKASSLLNGWRRGTTKKTVQHS